jgi:uncharacterized membrane-anchored protein
MRPVHRGRGVVMAPLRAMLLFLVAFTMTGPALADYPPPPDPAASLTPYQQDLIKTATVGPASIRLRDQAALSLPSGAAFIPQAAARTLMLRYGNKTDENFLGIIMPWEQSDWFITLEYFPAGYVSDEDAKNWNADDLLKSIRDNTEKDNADRRQRGVAELDIQGWVEKPHYDGTNHRLIWSILVKRKDAPAEAVSSINYRMYALGRQGYMSLTMVTDAAHIQARKPIAAAMLSHVSFDGGKRYGDFNSSTDHVAEYGLAALVGGVVIHKLGFFALIAAFLLKGAKFIAVLALGGVAAVRRFFTRKKPAEFPVPAPPAMQPQPQVDPSVPVEPPR